MSGMLGLALGAGLLLFVSPFLWPRRADVTRPSILGPRIRERLVQAGMGGVSTGVVISVSAVLGLTAGALVLALSSVTVLAAAAALGVTLVPAVVIGWRARANRKAARALWPDVIDQLISAVRSGLALPDSVGALAHGGPVQLRAAFQWFADEYAATGNFSSGLDGLKARLADPVADRILETLRMAREVGGSELVTVLRGLSAYLRQELAIRSEVEARQSWVVNAARLGVAAPWIVMLLLATRPEAAAAYNSAAGSLLILGGLAVSVVAYRLMLAVGRLPEEQRWFA